MGIRSDCELDTGWMVNTSPKGMDSKKPIKIEETKFPEKNIVVKRCSKNPFFFAVCVCFSVSIKADHRRWPSFRSRVVSTRRTTTPPAPPSVGTARGSCWRRVVARSCQNWIQWPAKTCLGWGWVHQPFTNHPHGKCWCQVDDVFPCGNDWDAMGSWHMILNHWDSERYLSNINQLLVIGS